MRKLNKKPSSHIQMRGFGYLIHSAFSLCLLVVMILLPLAPVFASEEIPPETLVIESEVVTESVVETEESESLPTDSESTPNSESGETGILNEVVEDGGEAPPQEVQEEEVIIVDSETSDSQAQSEIASESSDSETTTTNELILDTEEIQDTVTATSTETGLIEEESTDLPTEFEIEVIEEAETQELTNGDEEILLDSAVATTAAVAGEVVSVNSVVTDDNRFSFAKGECTLVSDETFYCAKAVAEPAVTHNDRVFAAADVDGDKEIFIEKDGVVSPITNNIFEDDAPFYDTSSETIVWHRLISGRYQIISFDIDTEKETQVTNDRYNNMYPSSRNGKMVWQGWVGNDWEIFLFQGNELTMITDNTTHDITPSVNGTHIIWQSFETGVWQMKVYDIQTKEIDTIEDTDGGSIENPRFVLVYDTKFESGDVETRGYDLVSGKVVPLSSSPAPVPSEIPDPDQTGEKSALVTPQTQLKTKVDGEDQEAGSGEGGIDPDIDADNLIVPVYVGTTTETIDEQHVVNDLDINDVLVLPVLTESSSSTDHIHDLIITPYTESVESGAVSESEAI